MPKCKLHVMHKMTNGTHTREPVQCFTYHLSPNMIVVEKFYEKNIPLTFPNEQQWCSRSGRLSFNRKIKSKVINISETVRF